jgi:hypothetical protein
MRIRRRFEFQDLDVNYCMKQVFELQKGIASYSLLKPYDGKPSRTVLRGGKSARIYLSQAAGLILGVQPLPRVELFSR